MVVLRVTDFGVQHDIFDSDSVRVRNDDEADRAVFASGEQALQCCVFLADLRDSASGVIPAELAS